MTERALADEIERLLARCHDLKIACENDPPSLAPWEDLRIAQVALSNALHNNARLAVSALRRPASPTVAAGDVAAAAIRVADATLCQWAPPGDCGRDGQPCLCEEAAKAALRRPEPAAGDVEAVARWLHRENGHGQRWEAACNDDPRLVAHYRARARGLLAALPRPEADEGVVAVTDAMVEAALGAYYLDFGALSPSSQETSRRAFRTALEAALAAAQEGVKS